MAEKQDATEANDSAKARDDGAARSTPVHWNDTKMATNFANVVNVQSTREQVDLFFGTNQTWNIGDERSVTVELSNRIILTPFAAKRMYLVLGGVLKEYESRHGTLEVVK